VSDSIIEFINLAYEYMGLFNTRSNLGRKATVIFVPHGHFGSL